MFKTPYYRLNAQQQKFAEQKLKILNLRIKHETDVTCIRYIDNIFILGLLIKHFFIKLKLN